MTRRGFLAASALMLAACSQSQDEPEDDPETGDGPIIEDDFPPDSLPADEGELEGAGSSDGTKILVAYYSRADENYAGGGTEWLEVGHTKVMAGYIAEALGADTYEIVPVEAYPEGYDDCCDVALEEQKNDARPAIAGELPDVSRYDTVFIGCPIWWGDEPMVVRTFVEGVDLSGKTIVPFNHEGGCYCWIRVSDVFGDREHKGADYMRCKALAALVDFLGTLHLCEVEVCVRGGRIAHQTNTRIAQAWRIAFEALNEITARNDKYGRRKQKYKVVCCADCLSPRIVKSGKGVTRCPLCSNNNTKPHKSDRRRVY